MPTAVTAGSETRSAARLKGRRRSGSRWAVPRYHPTPETGQRHSQRRVEEHRQDQTAGTSGAARRPGRRFHGTPRRAREERHGSETQIGRRRPQQTEAERRCRSGEGGRIGRGCAPLRLKGRVIRSRIGRTQFLADERQTAEALGGSASWRFGRVASRERAGRETRSGEHQGQNVPIMAPLELRRPEDWPRRRGAEGGRGSETPHRTRRCYGMETGRPENARDAKPARWSSRGTSC